MTVTEVAEAVGGRLVGDGGAQVTGVEIDSRRAGRGVLFTALPGEHVDGHDFAAAALAAGSPAVLGTRAVDGTCVVVDDATVALGRLASHQLARLTAPTLALTGSVGKTSVKDLLAHVLAAAGPTIAPTGSFNNELGVPLTVLRADADTAYLVLEMGARGVGHIAHLCAIAPPRIALVLNVGSAHVGEFGSPEAIAQAKGEIVEALPADGIAVLNADDPRVAAMRSRTRARVLTFGVAGDVALGEVRLDRTGEPHFTLTHESRTVQVHVPQMGEHHALNAAAAAAGAIAAGLDLDVVAERLGTARASSPMRMQRDVRADGLVVVNDAYNANPESMAASLRAVAALPAARHVAVLGEMLELGPDGPEAHRSIGRLARELGYDRVVVVGDGAAPVAEGAGDVAEVVPDVDVAISTLTAWLSADDVVVVKASRGCRLEQVADGLLSADGLLRADGPPGEGSRDT